MALDDDEVRSKLRALNKQYTKVAEYRLLCSAIFQLFYIAVIWDGAHCILVIFLSIHRRLKGVSMVQVKKVREPHPDIGCWWTLYDYGLDAVKQWDKDYKHPYPGTIPLNNNFQSG